MGQFIESQTGLWVGIFGTIFLFRKLFFLPSGKYLWADNFDAKLVYWMVNWGHHILFEAKDPLNFWNSNNFFPETNTLAYSESILGIQIFFSPLRFMGISPLKALYLSFAGFLILGCVLTAYALRRLNFFSTAEIIIITFVAHFGLSFTNILSHYQFFGFSVGPAFFLYLYLYLQDFKKSDMAMACALFFLGTTFSTYFAPMSVVVAVFIVIPSFIQRLRDFGVVGLIKKIGWGSLAIAFAFAIPLYLIQLRPYLSQFKLSASQPITDYIQFSAAPISIFVEHSINSFWYAPAGYSTFGEWEYAYFPGYLLLLGGFIYLAVVGAQAIKHLLLKILTKDLSLSQDFWQKHSFSIYWIIFFFMTWFLSFGPYITSEAFPSYPYKALLGIIPGLVNVRAPGRFGMWLGIPLAIFTVLLLRKIKVSKYYHNLMVILFMAVVIVESTPNHPIFQTSMDPNGIYTKLSQYISPGTPLIELPIFGKDNLDTLNNVMQQLIGSTFHWADMVVGYGAKASPTYEELLYLDSILQKGSDISWMLNFSSKMHISHYLVKLTAYPEEIQTEWKNLAAANTSCVFMEENNYILFEVNADSCEKPK